LRCVPSGAGTPHTLHDEPLAHTGSYARYPGIQGRVELSAPSASKHLHALARSLTLPGGEFACHPYCYCSEASLCACARTRASPGLAV